MNFDWYIISTVSSQEHKIAQAIMYEAAKRNIEHAFKEIIVPTETHTEIKRGKKVDVQKKILPGYIIVHMDMSEDAWGLVKRVPGVAKFLGADNRPMKVSEAEVQRILKKVEEGVVAKEVPVSFTSQEVVKIISGPFETFTGVVEVVDNEHRRLKVLVSILGREAPVELEFSQVEKV